MVVFGKGCINYTALMSYFPVARQKRRGGSPVRWRLLGLATTSLILKLADEACPKGKVHFPLGETRHAKFMQLTDSLSDGFNG